MGDDFRARESAGYRRSDVFPVGSHLIVPQNLAGTMLVWAIGMGVRWDFERTLRDDPFF